MLLAASDVVDLQYFLMDGARRYVPTGPSARSHEDDLLGSAAALDYVLLLASEHADETIDDASPVARGVRGTMTRASLAALDLADRMVEARDDAFADFAGRHADAGGIFDLLRRLAERGVTARDAVAFRALTAASDVAERRRRLRER